MTAQCCILAEYENSITFKQNIGAFKSKSKRKSDTKQNTGSDSSTSMEPINWWIIVLVSAKFHTILPQQAYHVYCACVCLLYKIYSPISVGRTVGKSLFNCENVRTRKKAKAKEHPTM